jgi:hypothetical protein
MRLVRRWRARDVHRHDQHRRAALRQRRLGGHGGHPPCLRRGADLLAEDAAGLVDRLEVHLLGEIEAELVADDLAGDQHHRRAIAVALVKAVDEVQAARPAGAGA